MVKVGFDVVILGRLNAALFFYINRCMAYTFFPEIATEIYTTLKNGDKAKVEEIVNVFTYLNRSFPEVKAPINIDPSKLTVVNISRSLQGDVDLKKVKAATKFTKISLKFGNGSSGNRGANNRGNAFEGIFAGKIREWWNGVKINDAATMAAIDDLNATYKLDKLKQLEVLEVGELNNKRPLVFSPNVHISSATPVSNNNIGEIVTDLTLLSGKKTIAYLSLKMGNTATFFNIGIKKVLIPSEIRDSKITNENGLTLLSVFNIKPAVFCDVFNGKLKKGYSEDVWPLMKPAQKKALQILLESGIGHGYHVIHKFPGKIKSVKIDEAYMTAAATPLSCVIHYGGKTGTGKRIDMEIETKKYFLKLNIRDTQGGDGYPTRLMGDFMYKTK